MDEKLTFPQKLLRLVPLIALPLVVGSVSAFITGNAMDSYGVMNQHMLSRRLLGYSLLHGRFFIS